MIDALVFRIAALPPALAVGGAALVILLLPFAVMALVRWQHRPHRTDEADDAALRAALTRSHDDVQTGRRT